jgi:hypothetical protein
MPHTGKTATVTASSPDRAAQDSKTSGTLLAFARLLARQAAAEAMRSQPNSAPQEGNVP